jgi:CheY-like chemotaxis protein
LASAELRGLRVLIAEPRERERRVLREQLEGLGVEIECAPDADSVLARASIAAGEARPFDLVFLSEALPSDLAFALPEKIRGRPEIARLQPLLLSTTISRRTIERAREAGFAAQITLPARQSHLHDCMLASLPERASRPQSATAAGALGSAADSEPRSPAAPRVLVAEDNPVNQKLAQRLLQKLGFEVEVVENGLEAVKAMAFGAYDAVLMDCQMPRMDGFEATREIRRREGPGRHTPIIAVTANAMPGDRERCLEAGMDDYVAKPVKRDALARTLERWLGRGAQPEACAS